MIMMTHQMLGDAVLYNFRGSSYNSKISLIVFILQQRKTFLWGSPGQSVVYCFHYFLKLPKSWRKSIIIVFSSCFDCPYIDLLPTEWSERVSSAFRANKPFSVSTLLEQELPFILADYAAIKCIIGSKVIKVMFHSRCNKKSQFQWNANTRGNEEQVFQSLPC